MAAAGGASKDEKWGAGPADDSIPPQIARLSGGTAYQTFSEAGQEELRLLSHDGEDGRRRGRGRSFDAGASNLEIIGPGPEEATDLESIKAAVSALRPYIVKKTREQSQSVQILEIYPTGESGYKSTMTLAELLVFVHAGVERIDSERSTSMASQNSLADLVKASDGSDSPGGDKRSPPSSSSGSSSSSSGNGRRESTRKFAAYAGLRELQYHDLRHLESQFNIHEEPTVLVRRHAVLISLNPLRAIVTAQKMLLIVPNGADALLYLLHEHMHGMVEDEGSLSPSPELRFYHAIFSTTVALHSQEYVHVCSRVEKVLQRFKKLKTVTIEVQEHIRILKNSVSSLYVKVNAYRRVLTELLGSPDDVALMNLSLLKDKPELYTKPLQSDILNASEEMEILVESYLMDYNSLETKLAFLKAQIQNAEELMSFRLDTARNELLIADTTLAVMMLTVGIATFLSSLFGMNIASGIETVDSPEVFWSVSSFLVVFCFFFTWLGFSYYRVTGILPTKPVKFKPILFEDVARNYTSSQ